MTIEQAGIKLVPIIEKDRQYYTGEVIYPGGFRKYRFSESSFSAKRYTEARKARRKAMEVGGHVVWFNPINGKTEEDRKRGV